MAPEPWHEPHEPMTFAQEIADGVRDEDACAEPEQLIAHERRRSPRVSVQRAMTIDFGQGPIDCLLADVNVGGVGVHLPRGCAEPCVGTGFSAELPLRGETVMVEAEIVWADTRPGRGPSFGARLVRLTPATAAALRRHVDGFQRAQRDGRERPVWVAKLNGGEQ